MGKEERTQYFVDTDQNAILLGDAKRNKGTNKAKIDNRGFVSAVLTCTSLWPYLWPRKNRFLQINVIVCVFILIATRGISVLVPMSYKKLINSFSEKEEAAGSGEDAPRWQNIVVFLLLKSLQGNHGYLNCLRSFLWIGVSQNSKKQLRVNLFSHIMNLSLSWHLQRKTGEVLRVMDRGVDSVNLILSQVLFNLVPAVLDVCIAIIFFIGVIDYWAGIIILLTMIGYLICTLVLSKWRAHFRREKNSADNQRNAAIVDSILNFETVKYHAAEEIEIGRYAEALDRHQSAEWRQNAAANLLNTGQRTVMMLGLMAGTLLYSTYVSTGRFTVGDYILYATYVEQLYGPLNTFGTYYKKLQQAFVDMENMFEMLTEKEEVVDRDDAIPLQIPDGQIEFDNVCFHYNPERPLLTNISFVIHPGQTFALVGHSGSGKSTIVRLLLRFYEPQTGCIKIDDTNINTVKQNSLRAQIGVVPQDTVLFNTDILHNIRYGRQSASDDDVVQAAVVAEIHKRIINFPDKYSSRVGERGLKLSGGEKQRIAIARTILKSPKVFLFDEATSSLDTRTEKAIHRSLSDMCKNKTTLIVAHRLSTIVDADQILVMKEGQIVERGTHEELLQEGNEYCRMWKEQLKRRQLESGDIKRTDSNSSSSCEDVPLKDAGEADVTAKGPAGEGSVRLRKTVNSVE